MSAQIIPIEWARNRVQSATPAVQSPTPKTERNERWSYWRIVNAQRKFWETRLEYMRALQLAQQHKIPEALAMSPHNSDDDAMLCRMNAVSMQQQLLAPVHNSNALNWKKVTLRRWRGFLSYNTIVATMARIEEQIADDEAWIKANKGRAKRSEN